MHPEVQAFFDKPTNTVSYVVKDLQSNNCAIIDPVLEYAPESGRTSTFPRKRLKFLSRAATYAPIGYWRRMRMRIIFRPLPI